MARPKKTPAAPVANADAVATADAPTDDADKQAAPHVDVDVGLVTMTKGGESLDVHHTCVADHARLGWKVAQ